MKRRQFLALGLTILAGCGAPQSTPAPTVSPVTASAQYDTSPKAVVLQQTTGGGFTTPLFRRLDELPQLRLYGDGRLIYQHYNAEGRMSWMEAKLQPAEVSALLTDVLGPKQELCEVADIPAPPVADAGNTRITVELTGLRCDVSVNALGMEGERTGITPTGAILLRQVEHAHKLIEGLRSKPGALYQPSEVILAIEPIPEHDEAVEWPFEMIRIEDNMTITGDQTAKVLEFASTPKAVKSGGKIYMIMVLPMMPS